MLRASDKGVSATARESWLYRLVVVVVSLLALLFVVQISVAGAYRDTKPDTAMAWWRSDSRAQARKAFLMVSADQRPASLARAKDLALRSLRRDAANVEALRTLGMIEEGQQRSDHALQLMTAAERISRRDLPTQLWLIEYYSARNDVAQTLRHYDTALRTSRQSREILFPILTRATADPQLVGPIAELLASRPTQWWNDFAAQLIDTGPNLPNVARIVAPVLDPSNPMERPYIGKLIARAAAEEQYDLAWQVFASTQARLRKPVSSGTVRDGDFSADGNFPPFDWQLSSDPSLYAARRSSPDDANDLVLAIVADNGRSGEVALQLLRLPAGRYRLQFDASAKPDDWNGDFSVSVTCTAAQSSAAITLRAYSNGARASKPSGEFEIPGGCTSQWLSIAASGDGPEPAFPAWIDRVLITAVAKAAVHATGQ